MRAPEQTTTLRDHLGDYLKENWPFDRPILWENMPTPSPLPKAGWIRFHIRHGRSRARGLGGRNRYRRGILRLEIATPAGQGMEHLDRIVEHLVELFEDRHLAPVRLGRVNVSESEIEHGFVITPVTVGFSHFLPFTP